MALKAIPTLLAWNVALISHRCLLPSTGCRVPPHFPTMLQVPSPAPGTRDAQCGWSRVQALAKARCMDGTAGPRKQLPLGLSLAGERDVGIREGEGQCSHTKHGLQTSKANTKSPRALLSWGYSLTLGERGRELREYGARFRLRESTSKAWGYSRCFQNESLPLIPPGMGEGLTLPGKCPFLPSSSRVCTFEWPLASEFSSASLI